MVSVLDTFRPSLPAIAKLELTGHVCCLLHSSLHPGDCQGKICCIEMQEPPVFKQQRFHPTGVENINVFVVQIHTDPVICKMSEGCSVVMWHQPGREKVTLGDNVRFLDPHPTRSRHEYCEQKT